MMYPLLVLKASEVTPSMKKQKRILMILMMMTMTATVFAIQAQICDKELALEKGDSS